MSEKCWETASKSTSGKEYSKWKTGVESKAMEGVYFGIDCEGVVPPLVQRDRVGFGLNSREGCVCERE